MINYQPFYKNLFRHSNIKKIYLFIHFFSSKYLDYFLPLDTSIIKPFISDEKIKEILSNPHIFLLDGDIIHVPFSKVN